MVVVIRSLIQGIISLVVVILAVFALTQLVGDPVNLLLGDEATTSQRTELRHQLGFDQPIAAQLGDYVKQLGSGDFGKSYWLNRSSIDVVAERLPRTILLSVAGMLIALLLAVPLATLAALRPGSTFDRIVSTISTLGLSIPAFWLGLMLILVFSVSLGVLPTSGSGDLQHLVLPALTLGLPAAGRIAIMSRSVLIEELGRPWVTMARMKGMPFRRVVGMHAFRNAGISMATISGWEFVRMIAGSTVIVEVVFAWPGIGATAIQAVEQRDIFLLRTIVLVSAVLVIAFNISIDVLRSRLDRRLVA